ncbi:MAG: ATP-binding protein [Paracoccaceae bacterium]
MTIVARPETPAGGQSGLSLTIASDPLAVRNALETVRCALQMDDVPDDTRSAAELVLAEVMNNIVEHAYRGGSGDMDLHLRAAPGGIRCEITDSGAPIPGGLLPDPAPGQTYRPDDLPEGGFGWFLIRTLAQDLQYRREHGRNCLSFFLRTDNTNEAGGTVAGQ